MKKDENLVVRVGAFEHSLVEAAAEERGKTKSEWVRSVLFDRAVDVLDLELETEDEVTTGE